MKTGILIIAHTPLASALRDCVLHVFPEMGVVVKALDVLPHDSPEHSAQAAQHLCSELGAEQMLVLTDVFGATPCNVAQRIVDGVHSKLIAGVNLPMLLRAVTYRHESLDSLVARSLSGAAQALMQVAVTAPLNQNRVTHDQDHNHHLQ
jgi:PTS system ascorbate-specific IIA component